MLPKHLDEKVTRLHLARLGAALTDELEYFGVPKGGPYRPEHYGY